MPCDLGFIFCHALPRHVTPAAKNQLNLASFQLNPGFATPQLDDMTQMLQLPRYLPFQRELEHQRPLPRKLPKTIL